jgi:hypothetical protein
MFHNLANIITGAALTNAQDSTFFYGFYSYQGTAAQNNEFSNAFVAAAGTYSLYTIGYSGPNRGIVHWYLDDEDTAFTTQDWYNAGYVKNDSRTSTDAMVVKTDGKHRLRGKIETKNASSSDYGMVLTAYSFYPSTD